VAAILLLTWTSASGQQPFPSDTLTAAVLSDWPPYYTLDSSGSPTGFAVETFEAVAREAGFVPAYRVFDGFGEAVEALNGGAVDVIPNMGIVEGRNLLFTTPVDAFDVVFFVRESSVDMRTGGDVRGRVAVVETNVAVELVADRPDLSPVVFSDVRTALFRLLAADVDAIAYPAPVLRALARDAQVLDRIVELEPSLREVRRAMALAPGQEELRNRLDDAVAHYLSTDEFRETYNRWHAPPSPFWTVKRVAAAGAAILALLLLTAGVWQLVSLRRFTAALQARERTFRALAEGLSECVMLVSTRDHSIEYVNGRCGDVLGREPQSMVGLSVTEWVPAAKPSPDPETKIRDMERADGTRFPAEVTVGPLLSSTNPPSYLVTIEDVTERRRAERQLRFQARLLDLIGEAVIATDAAGRVTYWNRYAEELYGWDREEAMGRVVMELTTPALSAGEAAEVMETVRGGEVWSGELVVSRRDGSRFPAHVTNAPIFKRDGEVAGIVGVSADLTEQKELEQKFLQAQKMEAIGRLAGGVAHDFNNLLTAIRGHLDLALAETPGSSPLAHDLAEARKGADRATALTSQLLAFSRRQALRPEVLDPCSIADNLHPMLDRLIGEDVQLDVRCDEPLWPLEVDRHRVEQVILNLAINARDAMPRGGRLIIAISNRPGTGRENRAGNAQDFVEIRVSDTGVGISPRDMDRVFEPFYTTKDPTRGTGLGLAVVHGVVSQSGGRIEVDSEPGEGTTFRVLLPRSHKEPNPPQAEEVEAVTPSVVADILLVEDDQAVRQLASRVLERAGHRVDAHASPAGALEALANDGRYDLLVTDVVIPEMTGPELANRVRERSPETAVLLTSGYSAEHVHGLTDGIEDDSPLLAKPFSPTELLMAVDEVLANADR
jgi:PAS domain S-box-containing protein